MHSNTSVVLAGGSLELPHLQHVREIYAGAGPALLWPLWRRRLLRADALACVSAAVAEQFGDNPKAFVLHDGLPRTPSPVAREAAREALDLPPDRFVVALLGRISDWKGQDVLAEALLQLGGHRRHRPRGGRRVARPGAARARARGRWPAAPDGRLRLLGFRDDVDTVLGAADAVAVPSKRPDPLPNSALEAAAAGLPLVAAAHGGLVEIVRDGETGLLVPPGDAAALAGALRRLAVDPGLRARLGEAAARDARRALRARAHAGRASSRPTRGSAASRDRDRAHDARDGDQDHQQRRHRLRASGCARAGPRAAARRARRRRARPDGRRSRCWGS